MHRRIFSPDIIWFMIRMKLIRCFAFAVILPRTLSFLPLSCSRHLENEILYFIITHVGYCDSSTTFYFSSSSLYPSVPSNPQFDSLPHCSWTDFLSLYPSDSSFAALSSRFTQQIKWNRSLFLRKSPELSFPIRADRLHFVCFASFINRSIDKQQSSSLRTAWHRKNLLDRLDREAVRHALYLFFSLSNRRRDRQRPGNASIERIRRAACSTRVVSAVCRYGAVDSGARSFDDVDGTQPIETNRFVADGRGVSLGTRSNSGGGEGERGDDDRRDDREELGAGSNSSIVRRTSPSFLIG